MNDLFGNPVDPRSLPYAAGDAGKRRPTKKNGYAGIPGRGPAGETCRSCKHFTRRGRGRKYLKCALERHRWTNGPGTDILASSPACPKWEANA